MSIKCALKQNKRDNCINFWIFFFSTFPFYNCCVFVRFVLFFFFKYLLFICLLLQWIPWNCLCRSRFAQINQLISFIWSFQVNDKHAQLNVKCNFQFINVCCFFSSFVSRSFVVVSVVLPVFFFRLFTVILHWK